MAKKKKNGLHIGNYVIRPLGLTIIGLLLVALIVVGTLIIARSISCLLYTSDAADEL